MFVKEPADQRTKKPYVKPCLATHGSVQKLTEKLAPSFHSNHDCGSNVRFPVFGSHSDQIW